MTGHGGLSIRRVTKAFGRDVVLSDVSLDVKDREILCLLGRSASGKSTLLRLIAGLTRPNAGKIFVGGIDVTHTTPQERDVGFVFQEATALFASMTVHENVRFGLRHGRSRLSADEQSAKVNEILAKTHMSGFANSQIETLSGGQKQRVALARTLVSRPKIVLLDEPLHSLDNVLRREMLDLIADLHNDFGATYLYVTHDEREAAYISHSVAVLDDGQVLPMGATPSAFNAPSTPRAATILGGWHVTTLKPAACAGWASALIPADLPAAERAKHLADEGLRVGIQISRVEAFDAGQAPHPSPGVFLARGKVVRIWPWYGRWRLRVICDDTPLEAESVSAFAQGQDVTLAVPRGACALWLNNQWLTNAQEAIA